MSDDLRSLKLDTSVPHSARWWDYLLGGKDNYAVDRAVGDAVMADYPQIQHIAKAGRAFLRRYGLHTARRGIRQFLDIGTGLPTAANTHEVVQSVTPESVVVYVDNDPIVLAHARALLIGPAPGHVAYVDADVRDIDTVIEQAGRTLDFTQPVAVQMFGILGHLADADNPAEIVRRLLAALPSGSYAAVNDSISTPASEQALEIARRGGANYHLRTPAQIGGFLDGLDLVEPGVVPTSLWRPSDTDPPIPPQYKPLDVYCAVGRKP